jgi:hypothetical protein
VTPAERIDEIRKMRATVQADRDRRYFDRQEARTAAAYLDDTGFLLDRVTRLEVAAAFAAQLVWNAPVGGTHDPDWEQRARDHLGKLERLLPGCLDGPVDLSALDEAGVS